VARKADTGEAVAATDFTRMARTGGRLRTLVPVLLLGCLAARAGVLPDDRADVLYHDYEGGGVSVSGPSLLVLKKIGQNVALTGNYYVDTISSASIDVQVISGASRYSEKRTEKTGGIDYQHGNSTLSMSYTSSVENDYKSDTANFGISMDMFDNMTTLTMGYVRGRDTVGQTGNPGLAAPLDRQNYRLGVSQVLTSNLVMELNYEGTTSEGMMNNPYRKVRYLDDTDTVRGYTLGDEKYPNTRTSSAVAIGARYYLPWRAALSGKYRFFADTWGIDAHTLQLGYTHPFDDHWTLESTWRYYTQSSADFYSDLLPFYDSQTFYGRDKELASFSSNSLGLKLTYDFLKGGWHGIDHASMNLAVNKIWFDYRNFRDLRVVLPAAEVGNEPLYSFSADVVQFFVSAWF
jgi:hypothetical protein